MKKLLLLALFVVVLAVAWRCLLFVDETQFVIVTQFGRPVRTLTEAGLYFKPPYQSSLAIDRRMQVYNPRPAEFLTSEKKNIDLDVFVCWSVEDPQRFLETVNDSGRGQLADPRHGLVEAGGRSQPPSAGNAGFGPTPTARPSGKPRRGRRAAVCRRPRWTSTASCWST